MYRGSKVVLSLIFAVGITACIDQGPSSSHFGDKKQSTLVNGGSPSSVWQYGAKRFAPRTAAGMYVAQRNSGQHMLSGRGDAQFIISMKPRNSAGNYRVVFIDGKDIAEIQQRADSVLSKIR